MKAIRNTNTNATRKELLPNLDYVLILRTTANKKNTTSTL
jgi:hypothetical protein